VGLAACSGLPLSAIAPKVRVAEIDVKRIGLLEQHFDVALRLTNPNEFDLTIEALEFEFELNGRAFAKGLSEMPTLIPATSSTVLRVDAMTQSTNLLQQIKILPETLKQGATYRIKGPCQDARFAGMAAVRAHGDRRRRREKPRRRDNLIAPHHPPQRVELHYSQRMHP